MQNIQKILYSVNQAYNILLVIFRLHTTKIVIQMPSSTRKQTPLSGNENCPDFMMKKPLSGGIPTPQHDGTST